MLGQNFVSTYLSNPRIEDGRLESDIREEITDSWNKIDELRKCFSIDAEIIPPIVQINPIAPDNKRIRRLIQFAERNGYHLTIDPAKNSIRVINSSGQLVKAYHLYSENSAVSVGVGGGIHSPAHFSESDENTHKYHRLDPSPKARYVDYSQFLLVNGHNYNMYVLKLNGQSYDCIKFGEFVVSYTVKNDQRIPEYVFDAKTYQLICTYHNTKENNVQDQIIDDTYFLNY